MRHQLNLTNYQDQPQFGWTGPIAQHENFQCFVMEPRPIHLKVEDYLNGDPFFDIEEEK